MTDSSWRQFLTQQGATWDNNGPNSFGGTSFASIEKEQSLIAPLSHWSLLKVTGPDARTFLQGQLTCDIKQVNQQQWLRFTQCDNKGRVLFSGLCFCEQNNETDICLLIPSSTIQIAQTHFAKYSVFSKIEIHAENSAALIGVINLNTGAKNILGYSISGSEANTFYLRSTVTLALPHNRAIAVLPQDQAPALWRELSEFTTATGYPSWELSSIRAGFADVADHNSGEFIPQLLNFHLTQGISFTKGCYLGQEVVARTEYKGKLKRHLQHVTICQISHAAPGDDIFSEDGEKKVGSIVQVVQTGTDSFECLAVMTDAAVESGDAYFKADKLHKIQFHSLPYAITK